jgi:hypothetical protein
MFGLARTFLDYDLQLLRQIAAACKLSLTAKNARDAAQELARALLQPMVSAEIYASLPAVAQQALVVLQQQQGMMPLASFSRQFGEIRPLGPAAREREQPHLRPLNAAEWLWYRGWLGRAFAKTSGSLKEFCYIPLELLAVLAQVNQAPAAATVASFGKAVDTPSGAVASARSMVVDDAATLLASYFSPVAEAWHNGDQPLGAQPFWQLPAALTWLQAMLRDLGCLTHTQPDPVACKAFLRKTRAQQMHALGLAWLHSITWHDLLQTPSLQFEQTEPLRVDLPTVRQRLLAILAQVPVQTWVSLPDLLLEIRSRQPDLLRPNGDYDSWYVRSNGAPQSAGGSPYLRGFMHWLEVEGAFITCCLLQPLHWLGCVEFAPVLQPNSLRLTRALSALLEPASSSPEASSALQVQADGTVIVKRLSSRWIRFQVARVAEWLPSRSLDFYKYRLTAASLKYAAEQQIQPQQVLQFLQKHSQALPPKLVQAIESWQPQQPGLTLRSEWVLRAASVAQLDQLRQNPQIRRCLGESLGELAIAIPARQREALQAALLQAGLLVDVRS